MDDLEKAVFLRLGYGEADRPRRNEDLVIQEFGQERGGELLQTMRAMVQSLFDPSVDPHNLPQVRARLRASYPHATERTIQAITWWYSYDNR